jgi:hypothetical protein
MNELATVRRASANATAASQKRDEAIRAAYASGFSVRAIAAEASLSSARIHQIVHYR